MNSHVFLAVALFCLPVGIVAAADPAPATTPAPAATAAPYPLDTCVVSGDKLGAMGDFVPYTYEGREVRFCCKGCIADFNKDPATYMAKLDAAAKAQAAGVKPGDAKADAGKPADAKPDGAAK